MQDQAYFVPVTILKSFSSSIRYYLNGVFKTVSINDAWNISFICLSQSIILNC